LDGSFYVTGARPRLLALGTLVTVAGREAAIVRHAGTERRPIVRLDGVEDRSAAEELRGLELTVRAQATALSEGEWWAHELEGCEVFDGERRIGAVTRMIELPSCEALEVKPEHGGEPLLVPMVKDAISQIEVERRRIEVNVEFLGLRPRAQAAAAPAGRRRGR
jgi:16S rRNA processing protein RimM